MTVIGLLENPAKTSFYTFFWVYRGKKKPWKIPWHSHLQFEPVESECDDEDGGVDGGQEVEQLGLGVGVLTEVVGVESRPRSEAPLLALIGQGLAEVPRRPRVVEPILLVAQGQGKGQAGRSAQGQSAGAGPAAKEVTFEELIAAFEFLNK